MLPLQPSTYRPYFKDAAGLYLLLAFLFGILIWGSFHTATGHDQVFTLVLALGVLSLALTIRFRFFVRIDEESLTAHGFFREHSLRWSEITEVIAPGASSLGSGFDGPFTYRFRGEGDTVTINFKLFSRECIQVIFREIERLNLEITHSKD